MLLTYCKRVYIDANPYGYPAYIDSNGVLWADLTPTSETAELVNLANAPNSADCKRFTFAAPREPEVDYLWNVRPCNLADADALRDALPAYRADAEKAGLTPTITGFIEYIGHPYERYRNYKRKRKGSESVKVVEALRGVWQN